MEVWGDAAPAFPEADISEIAGRSAPEYYEVCCCFYLFRYLHGFDLPRTTLLGDYCFARFSRLLADLDSVYLNNAFARYLREDTAENAGLCKYLNFIEGLSENDISTDE